MKLDEWDELYILDKDELDFDLRYCQKIICPVCNKFHTILSQEDNGAEYITQISIVCDCNEILEIRVPVN